MPDEGPVLIGDDLDDYQGSDERRRRDWLPWLVLLMVLLAIAWLVCRYSDLGKAPDVDDIGGESIRLVRIPDVTGLEQSEAERALTGAGFSVEVDSSFDAVALAGEVVSQDPLGGERAAIGSTVFIGVSAGSGLTPGEAAAEGMEPSLHIPDVTGRPLAEAQSVLAAAGFKSTVSQVYSASVAKGEVADQTPTGGSTGTAGQVVGLMVSAGDAPPAAYTVPDIVGLARAAAVARVKAAGLEPRVMYQPKPGYVGQVFQQSPDPGTAVPADRYVFMLVGARP